MSKSIKIQCYYARIKILPYGVHAAITQLLAISALNGISAKLLFFSGKY